MLTNENWVGFSEFLYDMIDTYSEETAFKIADLIDSDLKYLKVKELFEKKLSESVFLDTVRGLEPHPINQFIYLPEDFEEYKQKVRECLHVTVKAYTPEDVDKLMSDYADDIEEAFYDFKWEINVTAGAIASGLW